MALRVSVHTRFGSVVGTHEFEVGFQATHDEPDGFGGHEFCPFLAVGRVDMYGEVGDPVYAGRFGVCGGVSRSPRIGCPRAQRCCPTQSNQRDDLGRKSLHVQLTPVVIDIVDMPLTINSQHPSKPNKLTARKHSQSYPSHPTQPPTTVVTTVSPKIPKPAQPHQDIPALQSPSSPPSRTPRSPPTAPATPPPTPGGHPPPAQSAGRRTQRRRTCRCGP